LKLEKDLHKDFQISEMRDSASKACTMLRTLANEDRLLILCQLIDGPRTVGELESLLGIRQPTLSQQLTVLRQESLVSTERNGKYIIYSLASSEVVQIMQTLYRLYCGTKGVESGEDSGSDLPARGKYRQAR
jgi:DNA-binding transcriptional ArsR family regulator